MLMDMSCPYFFFPFSHVLHDRLSVITYLHLLLPLPLFVVLPLGCLLPSTPSINNILSAMTLDKKFSLEEYKGILIDHENDYRDKQGVARQGLLTTMIKKMIAQSQNQLSNSDAGALETVCWPLINRFET
jgi:hypothetical protein